MSTHTAGCAPSTLNSRVPLTKDSFIFLAPLMNLDYKSLPLDVFCFLSGTKLLKIKTSNEIQIPRECIITGYKNKTMSSSCTYECARMTSIKGEGNRRLRELF